MRRRVGEGRKDGGALGVGRVLGEGEGHFQALALEGHHAGGPCTHTQPHAAHSLTLAASLSSASLGANNRGKGRKSHRQALGLKGHSVGWPALTHPRTHQTHLWMSLCLGRTALSTTPRKTRQTSQLQAWALPVLQAVLAHAPRQALLREAAHKSLSEQDIPGAAAGVEVGPPNPKASPKGSTMPPGAAKGAAGAACTGAAGPRGPPMSDARGSRGAADVSPAAGAGGAALGVSPSESRSRSALAPPAPPARGTPEDGHSRGGPVRESKEGQEGGPVRASEEGQ